MLASASPRMTNHPWKGAWSGHRIQLNFFGPQSYLWNGWS